MQRKLSLIEFSKGISISAVIIGALGAGGNIETDQSIAIPVTVFILGMLMYGLTILGEKYVEYQKAERDRQHYFYQHHIRHYSNVYRG